MDIRCCIVWRVNQSGNEQCARFAPRADVVAGRFDCDTLQAVEGSCCCLYAVCIPVSC